MSVPTIKRWLKRRRETGDVQPKPIPGRPPRKGTLLQSWLPKHLQENHDLTLEEHSEAFEEEFGQTVSTSTVGRAIAALPDGGWPLKKVESSPRARRRSERALAVVPRSLRDVRRLVFVDESGFHIALDRLRARAPRGQRAYGGRCRGTGARTSRSSLL